MCGGPSAAALRKPVIWFDRRMGPAIGTNKRVNKADIRALDDKHNFDCRDTTRNTTRLLLVLQEWGLLKYHVVGDPHYRGNALVLQTPHNTAVLVERATRVEWVVDLWPRGYLQPPDVMTLEKNGSRRTARRGRTSALCANSKARKSGARSCEDVICFFEIV